MEEDYEELEILKKDTFTYDEGTTIINNYYENDSPYNFLLFKNKTFP